MLEQRALRVTLEILERKLVMGRLDKFGTFEECECSRGVGGGGKDNNMGNPA